MPREIGDERKAMKARMLKSLGQARYDGITLASEPVWIDRLAEILDQLPDDTVNALAARVDNARGAELVDFDEMAKVFGLTPAETKIVESVVEGLSVPEHAERHAISVNTARVHMQRVLSKTNTRRQTDLLRLALQRR